MKDLIRKSGKNKLVKTQIPFLFDALQCHNYVIFGDVVGLYLRVEYLLKSIFVTDQNNNTTINRQHLFWLEK